LRQCFIWLLRFDFVLSWNFLFGGPLVLFHRMFVQVSRLEIAEIKRQVEILGKCCEVFTRYLYDSQMHLVGVKPAR
jgi:hypothetical protein